MTSLGNPFPFLFFFDERPAKPKVQPKDAQHHKKNKSTTQGMQDAGGRR